MFEWEVRVRCLFFCWVFCVEKRSLRLWILWFDLDFFFIIRFEFVAFSIFFSILKNLVNENQSSMSFFFVKKKFEIEKEIIFIFRFSVCVFINSSIENLFVFVFFVFVLNFSISFVWSSAFLSSKKCEFVQEEKKKFLNEKLVIKNDVSNLCETSNSNLSSLNKSCVEVIEIEGKKKRKEIVSVLSSSLSTLF